MSAPSSLSAHSLTPSPIPPLIALHEGWDAGLSVFSAIVDPHRQVRDLLKEWSAARSASSATPNLSLPQAQTSRPIKDDPDHPPDLWQVAYATLDDESRLNFLHLDRLMGMLARHSGHARRVLYQKHQAKGLVFNLGHDRVLDIRGTAQNVLRSALAFKDVVSAAAAFDPTGHASSAWTVVSLANATHSSSPPTFSPTPLPVILSWTAIIASGTSKGSHIDRAITNVYIAILNSAEVVVTRESNRGVKIIESILPPSETALKQLETAIGQADTELGKWIQVDESLSRDREAREILAGIDRLQSSINQINDQIPALPEAEGVTFESFANQDDPRCLENIRVDIFRTIYDWAVDPDTQYSSYLKR
ncbi:uncharacterized protein BO97DRAFT_428839 [Aspergillus homomorphus CBS 101889]|uniref:NWD NACHT-NTPase N-terminal domain-containing protein n=1 Tax=Aspergillus homomorphus (strain CBS 101889) TaxID=1450537 RepID=A0A395HJ06_ASPHC|nr:hypothetical protein BO97DRAFT_428839 [Aspergillus homomorphus CBS 101889]RAL07912.1 hypothetical protein BO97DRAFT_428839 [Aspergillus homomorphus CBS 101889]